VSVPGKCVWCVWCASVGHWLLNDAFNLRTSCDCCLILLKILHVLGTKCGDLCGRQTDRQTDTDRAVRQDDWRSKWSLRSRNVVNVVNAWSFNRQKDHAFTTTHRSSVLRILLTL
jgi:hypothetical protein